MHLDTRECASTSFLFNQHKINANKKSPLPSGKGRFRAVPPLFTADTHPGLSGLLTTPIRVSSFNGDEA